MPLEDRRRDVEPNHVRTYATQQLDALIRIEELLQKLVEAGGVRVQDSVSFDVSEPKAVAKKPVVGRRVVDRL